LDGVVLDISALDLRLCVDCLGSDRDLHCQGFRLTHVAGNLGFGGVTNESTVRVRMIQREFDNVTAQEKV